MQHIPHLYQHCWMGWYGVVEWRAEFDRGTEWWTQMKQFYKGGSLRDWGVGWCGVGGKGGESPSLSAWVRMTTYVRHWKRTERNEQRAITAVHCFTALPIWSERIGQRRLCLYIYITWVCLYSYITWVCLYIYITWVCLYIYITWVCVW